MCEVIECQQHIQKGDEMANGFKYSRKVLSTSIRVHHATEFGLVFPDQNNLAVTFMNDGRISVGRFSDLNKVTILNPVEVPNEVITKLENFVKATEEIESERKLLKDAIAL